MPQRAEEHDDRARGHLDADDPVVVLGRRLGAPAVAARDDLGRPVGRGELVDRPDRADADRRPGSGDPVEPVVEVEALARLAGQEVDRQVRREQVAGQQQGVEDRRHGRGARRGRRCSATSPGGRRPGSSSGPRSRCARAGRRRRGTAPARPGCARGRRRRPPARARRTRQGRAGRGAASGGRAVSMARVCARMGAARLAIGQHASMADMPAAEHDVDAELVRGLLADQQPDLADRPLRHLAHGWDNESFRLGDDLVVRLPRRAMAAELVLHEQRWLGELAGDLPLPIPAVLRAGRPGRGYPWSWSVVPWLPGGPWEGGAARRPRAGRRRPRRVPGRPAPSGAGRCADEPVPWCPARRPGRALPRRARRGGGAGRRRPLPGGVPGAGGRTGLGGATGLAPRRPPPAQCAGGRRAARRGRRLRRHLRRRPGHRPRGGVDGPAARGPRCPPRGSRRPPSRRRGHVDACRAPGRWR